MAIVLKKEKINKVYGEKEIVLFNGLDHNIHGFDSK